MPTIHRSAILAATAALALLVVPATAESQAPSAGRMGLVDVGKVVAESARGKKALEGLKKLADEKKAAMQAKVKEMDDLKKRIDTGRTTLSADALAGLQRELDDKVTMARRFQEDADRQVSAERDRVLEELDKVVMPVINQLGKEGGYSAIFRKFESGLVYADDTLDLTAAVIQRLDSSAPAAAPVPSGRK